MNFQWFVGEEFCGWVLRGLSLPAGLSTEAASASSLRQAEMLLDCRLRNIFRAPLEQDGQSVDCFFYFFRHNSLLEALRSPPPFHILRISKALREEGFDTLEVLAALKPKRRLLKWTSLLIAREITSVSELPSAGSHVFQIHEWADFGLAASSALALELARFHDSSFFHGDLKSRHILARQTAQEERRMGEAAFVLVDLEKAGRKHYLPYPARDILAARDLIQLLSSLPAGSGGSPIHSARTQLVEHYLVNREISLRRKRFIERILTMYAPGGVLVQGKTVLGGLAAHLTRKDSD